MDYTKYVDTNIGTIGHLLQATMPNVQSPHGAAVLNPAFRPGVTDRYISDKIFGFNAGNAVIMAYTGEKQPNYVNTASGFDHDLETAKPDWYKVWLEDWDAEAELTAYKNYGRMRFTFGGDEGYVVLYTGDESRREGARVYLAGSGATGRNGLLGGAYQMPGEFVGAYDAAIPVGRGTDTLAGKAYVFKVGKAAEVAFALATTGEKESTESLEKDALAKSFEQIRQACNAAWNGVLGKVRVQGGTKEQLTAFYTAIYRATSRMHDYSVGGKYLGFDGQVHGDEGFDYMCDDGIWDTYRGMHPLQLILEPKAHRDTIESYLRMYKQSGWLPRFPYLAGNTPCMLGHHTVSILAESAVKGVDFDLQLAYEAAHKNATKRTMLPWRDGEAEEYTQCYYVNGFFPALEEGEKDTDPRVHPFENRQAVAVTVEHSYDDHCMAVLAEAAGHPEEAEYFRKRSLNYKKLYDGDMGFMHPRTADGEFTKVYDPKYCGGQGGRQYFAENNAYIYNFAAQHDICGTVEMMGGPEAFAAKLDNLFVEQYDGKLKSEFLAQYPDATGTVGQFCMGNEPSFHIPYLYNYCGQAYKTQKKVRQMLELWFPATPLGICGDEDGGAMSAFMAFSAMGFYPVNPASGRYDIGTPLFDRVEIDMPSGKTFTVEAQGASGKAKYIQAAALDGEALKVPYFTHGQMESGATLVLTMGEKPNKGLFA